MSSSNLPQRLCQHFGLPPDRSRRALGFTIVGATGALVDLAVTLTLLTQTHYLTANTLGFLTAVSWNFTGNWWLVYQKPSGSLPRQYASYVSLHTLTFGLRALTITLLIEPTPTPPAVATIIGIGVAAIANFLGTERILHHHGELWFDAVATLNQLAHRLYDSRLRTTLRTLNLYNPLYTTYQHLLGILYRADTHEFHTAGASARFHTQHPPEIVSILHTLEKETEFLEAFLQDLHPNDTVWDVGANLGVYTALAASIVDNQVVGFEPYWRNAQRARDNLDLNAHRPRARIAPIALGDTAGLLRLSVERHEVGTQTPTTTQHDDDTIGALVDQLPGDAYHDWDSNTQPPTVIKIDVEGAEHAVLQGLHDTLESGVVRLVYVETHDSTFHDTGDEPAIRSLLEDHGFNTKVVEGSGQTYLRAENPGWSA